MVCIGASLVISYSQGREVVEKQRQQYSNVVISDLPDRLTLKKVAANLIKADLALQ
uniref:Uncharacterized protein n=1 Tax=Nelumbo nucifera TaxID=4432 RepID=A0A822Z4P1_NELNU|nr:TPA_asm: hypothetical protein HUJ06_009019 [Nelumbo nucifera]